MRVIELINKLEQFPPDYIVRFEDEYDNNGYHCFYGTTIEDVSLYPNETCGMIQLIGRNKVRADLKEKLEKVILDSDELEMSKFLLEAQQEQLKRKKKPWEVALGKLRGND